MTNRVSRKLLIIASLMCVFAAGANDTVDVLGLTVGMPAAAVESSLLSKRWTKEIDNTYEMSQADLVYTLSQVFKRDNDKITVTYTTPPVEPRLIRIDRNYKRSTTSLVPFEKTMASLIKKYGEPTGVKDLALARALRWYKGSGDNCGDMRGVNRFINESSAILKREGLDAAIPCPGIAIEINAMKFKTNAGIMTSGITTSLVDIREAALDPLRLQAHASEIVRKKQEAMIDDSSGPEL